MLPHFHSNKIREQEREAEGRKRRERKKKKINEEKEEKGRGSKTRGKKQKEGSTEQRKNNRGSNYYRNSVVIIMTSKVQTVGLSRSISFETEFITEEVDLLVEQDRKCGKEEMKAVIDNLAMKMCR